MNSIFPVDLLDQICFTDKKATVTDAVGDQTGKQENKPSLDNLESQENGGDFSENLTKFLMTDKQKPTREEKIEKADRLGLV